MKINSEIFDEYAKIALEEGLISEAEEKTNPRYDSLELSDIEILYNIKPNGEDDDILDKAHPAPVIIAPAYDRVNGLVENLKERQKVMIGIAMKPTQGTLTGHRYASANQELLDEVIKVSFMLDKNDQEELMSLADSCSEALTKTAIAPLIIAGIIAGVVALFGAGGVLYTSNNPKSQGIKNDALRALSELDDVVKKYPEAGVVLSPVITNIQKVVQLSDAFVSYNDQLVSGLLQVSSAGSTEDKKKMIAKNATVFFRSGKDKEILNVFTKFKEVCDAVVASVPEALRYLAEVEGKYESSDPQFWRSIKNFVHENIVSSDVEDAIRILSVLANSCAGVSASIVKSTNNLNALKDQASQGNVIPDLITEIKDHSSDQHDPSAGDKGTAPGALPSWA